MGVQSDRHFDTMAMGSLLAKNMTARDGMGHVGPGGVALETDIACRVWTDHQHDDRERKGLVKDPRRTWKRRNKEKSNGYKERAALRPGQVRVLAWIGANAEHGHLQHWSSDNIIRQTRGR